MAKTFQQAITDVSVLANDATLNIGGSNETTTKSLLNMGIKFVLSMADWNFNKTYVDITSVDGTQGYAIPQNAARVSDVFVYANSIWYTPVEIKDETKWRQLNYTTTDESDATQFWHFSMANGKVELYPTPASNGNTIRVNYTKKVRDLSDTTGYSTGTISTTANGSTITGAGTTFTARMVGSSLKITSTTTAAGDFWYEIMSYTSALSIAVKPTVPATIAGASYTINEMIPFAEGFEDIAIWFALDKYYQTKEMPGMANQYSMMWRDALQEMKARDQRSVKGLLKREDGSQVIDSNYNPWTISIS